MRVRMEVESISHDPHHMKRKKKKKKKSSSIVVTTHVPGTYSYVNLLYTCSYALHTSYIPYECVFEVRDIIHSSSSSSSSEAESIISITKQQQ